MFTNMEQSLLLRALNTERNNLAKWYGMGADGFTPISWSTDVVFSNPVWQEQIDALNSAEEKLIEGEISNA